MHKIQYPTFDIHFQDPVKDTRDAQNQAVDWVKSLFLPVIEQVLDEFDSKGMTIKIEQIALDLGTFTTQNLKHNAPDKLRNALRNAILDKFSMRNFQVEATGIEEMPEAEHIFEMLVHYLSSGRGSWQSGNFSKELDKFLALQNINYDKKEKKLKAGTLGEPIGTLAHTFDFENFLEVLRQTEPEILQAWFEEFGHETIIQKRLARQVKAEILWQWIGGADSIAPLFLQNMFQTLAGLNKYTWKMPEARLKSIFNETILSFFANKISIKDTNPLEVESIFFVFIQKIENVKNYDAFFEKYRAQIALFLNNHTNQHIFYESIKENYTNFIADKTKIVKQENNFNKFLEKDIVFFTNQDKIVKSYLENIIYIFQEEDEDFLYEIKNILLNFLEKNVKNIFSYQFLVENTFSKILKYYTIFANKKYVKNNNIYTIINIWQASFQDIQNQLFKKTIKREEIKFINNLYNLKDILESISDIKNKSKENITRFESFLVQKYEKIQKDKNLTEKLKKIEELKNKVSEGRQGAMPENKLMAIIKEVEPAQAEKILMFIRELSSKYKWAKVSAPVFKQKIWELVADYLIENQYTAFNFEKFSKQILVEVQDIYALKDIEMEFIIKQLKTEGINQLAYTLQEFSLEQWRDIWKKTTTWQEVSEKVFDAEDKIINEPYILRIAFDKYDSKILKIAKKITIVLNSFSIQIKYTNILKDWLAYRWTIREKTFNLQKEIIELIEIVLSYKRNIPNITSDVIQNMIGKINVEVKLKEEELVYLQETYIKDKIETTFFDNIEKKSAKEIITYLYDLVPTKIAWIKKIIKSIFDELSVSNELEFTDFEQNMWVLTGKFVLENKENFVESKFISYLYEAFSKELKEIDVDNLAIFEKAIKNTEVNKKYILKVILNFIQTGEWLWTSLLEVSFSEKEKIALLETYTKQILEIESLRKNFINVLLNVENEKIATFIAYIFQKIQNENVLDLYAKFLGEIMSEKEKNKRDYIDFTQKILPYALKYKKIVQKFQKSIEIFVAKQGLNTDFIDIIMSTGDGNLQKLFQNIQKIIQNKNLAIEEPENTIFSEINYENITEIADFEKNIWQKFKEKPFPLDTFEAENTEKQARILVEFIDTPSKILTLLNSFFPKPASHEYIPQEVFKLLTISNLTEVLRLYFSDVLLIWLDTLPAQRAEAVGKANVRVGEYYEKQIKIFKQDIQDIKNNIKNETYLPPDIAEKSKKSKEELKELAKKLDKATQKWNDEPLYIQNAGMVILHPFLMRLFDMLKLTEKNQFKSEWEASKAVYMLEYLVRKEYEEIDEANLVLNKILCGVPISVPLWKEIKLNDQEKELGETLLQAVIQNWGVLGKASPESLRNGFLQREGRLSPEGDAWRLRVEQKGMDILVESLPWTLSMIKNPLMKGFIYTEWT